MFEKMNELIFLLIFDLFLHLFWRQFNLLVTVAGATIYYAIKTSVVSPFDFPIFKTMAGLFEFVGVCVFSMEGVGVTLAIENNMAEPKKIPIVLAGGSLLSFFLFY